MLLDFDRRNLCRSYLLHKSVGNEDDTFAFLKQDSSVLVISEDRLKLVKFKQIFSGIIYQTMQYDKLWGLEARFESYDEASNFYNILSM
jgi:hypothetical protein